MRKRQSEPAMAQAEPELPPMPETVETPTVVSRPPAEPGRLLLPHHPMTMFDSIAFRRPGTSDVRSVA